jgi:hypothetical protein
MKKLFISMLFLASTCSFVTASELADNCGCGLGTLILDGNDGLILQVLAVTTNGTFGNQTFGITSGTLDCDQPVSLVSNEKLNIFVAGNMDNLAKDIAMGQGESLATLAELLEISGENQDYFFANLQSNFANIFTSENITHADVIRNVLTVSGKI